MSKVIFKRKSTDEIENLEVQDGSLIFNTETGAIFMDYGTKRISIFDNLYPIGSIIIRDNDVDMSNYLGFTWTKVFAGKVLVGVDSTDNDFKTVGKTGGSKDLQEHTHYTVANNAGTTELTGSNTIGKWAVSGTSDLPYSLRGRADNPTNGLTSKAGTGNSGNLQPYQVVAYWKRIS